MSPPRTFRETLQAHARRPEQPPIRVLGDPDTVLTYRELWRESGRYAAGLRELGVGSGDRVALSMATLPEVVIAILAIWRLDATIVSLVPQRRLRPGKPQTASLLAALRTSQAPLWLEATPDVRPHRSLVEKVGLETTVIPLQQLAEAPGSSNEESFPIPEKEGGLLQFSSGSTAAPKGISLTSSNLLSSITGTIERLGIRSDDRYYSWLPLYHDMGLIGFLLIPLYLGADLCLCPSQRFIRRPLLWLEHLSRFRTSVTCAPQFAYNLCLQKSDLGWSEIENLDLTHLRLALNGAEAVHSESCQKFEERLAPLGLRPHVVQACYGLAENCLAVTLRRAGTPPEVRHLHRGALAEGRVELAPEGGRDTVSLAGNGRTITGTKVRILNDGGVDLGPGAVGEIYIRGDASTAAFVSPQGVLEPSGQDGWVATGDLGTWIDDELYIVGRLKEIFKKGGRTFAPADIEISLTKGLDELTPGGVAAVGVYDSQAGQEELVVFAELSPKVDGASGLVDRIRLQVLREFQLATKEVVLVLRGGLPKTTSGKIQRLALRRAHTEGQTDSVVRRHPAQTRVGN